MHNNVLILRFLSDEPEPLLAYLAISSHTRLTELCILPVITDTKGKQAYCSKVLVIKPVPCNSANFVGKVATRCWFVRSGISPGNVFPTSSCCLEIIWCHLKLGSTFLLQDPHILSGHAGENDIIDKRTLRNVGISLP